MPDPVRAAATADLPPGGSLQVTVKGVDIALFHAAGKVCAVDNTCPHRGGPLAEGQLNSTTVSCPWHGWEFDVTTGACLTHPAARLKTYPVHAQGNDLFVTL